ncbi:MAG: insulinase family protein [Chloroflexi bacterium]|nr:insulinase family protein [Chloroflexota bacterium]
MPIELSEFTLKNGLQVLLKEIHTTPIVSQWIWYRVGSRNEKAGIQGISHWVEHLQFKGTPKYPIDELDHAISRVGGVWNAMTHLDWTTYYETLPSQELDLVLDLEADRMQNSTYDKDEINAERTVIISELEGNENEPLFHLNSAIQKAAFQVHPYNHDVIGTLEDLQAITHDQLYDYYRMYYRPGNAVLAIAGDFDSDTVRIKIDDIFSTIPDQPGNEKVIPQEPPQTEEQYFEIKGPGDALYIQISYRAPCANDPDFFTLALMDSLLSGPSPLVMFGGGSISNRTSRLYQALVEKDLAVSISGGIQSTLDPFLHTFVLTLEPGSDVQAALQAFDEQIENIQQQKVTAQEIERAARQAEAMFDYGSENITNQAFWMGYSNIFADYQWYEEYTRRLQSVSAEQILAFAQNQLASQNRIIGLYIPTPEAD